MPALPSLGFILTTLKLDRPSRTYRGPGDTIAGSIVLQWQPPDKGTVPDELFGPLRVDAELEGLLKVHAAEDRGKGADTSIWYRRQEERLLCRRAVLLWDGPVRIKPRAPVQYDFVIDLPESPEEDVSGLGLPEPLPPSFKAEVSILNGEGTAEAAYRVLAKASMPGIDVRVVSRGDAHAIRYEAPSYPPQTPAGTDEHAKFLAVRSRYLLPEAERPKGFKAMFAKNDDMPRFDFSVVFASFPKSLTVDKDLVFEIRIVPRWQFSTTKIVPEVALHKCKVTLRTITEIRTRDAGDRKGVSTGPGLRAAPLSVHVSPEGLFLGSDKGEPVCKTVTAALPKALEPTLLLENVQRTYEVQVEVELKVAREVSSILAPIPVSKAAHGMLLTFMASEDLGKLSEQIEVVHSRAR